MLGYSPIPENLGALLEILSLSASCGGKVLLPSDFSFVVVV